VINLISKNPLVRQIVEKSVNTDIVSMLFAKSLPFTDEEFLETFILIFPERPDDHEKLNALVGSIPLTAKEKYIERHEANLDVAHYLIKQALEFNHSTIINKAIHNHHYPVEILLMIARFGSVEMLEMLLENQIKLIAFPEVLNVMENNPAITNFIKGKIQEIRSFYLKDTIIDNSVATVDIEDAKRIIATEIDSASDAMEFPDEVLEVEALTTLQKLSRMNLSEKVRLALFGSKTERMMLLLDQNKLVSQAALDSPKISQDEILLAVMNKSTSIDIIAKIAKNNNWTKNYRIMIELIHNPKTPISYAVSFIKKLRQGDIKLIMKDKNMNPVIRNIVIQLQHQKK
jgi:hypothetical protein